MIRKGREKVLLSTDILAIFTAKPRDSTNKLLQIVRKFNTFAEYKINIKIY